MRWLTILLLGGLLVLSGTDVASAPAADTPAAAHAVTSMSKAGIGDECTVECEQGFSACESDLCEHRAPDVGEGGSHEIGEGDHPHCWEGYCNTGSGGTCEAKHKECDSGQHEQLEELVDLLDAGDLASVFLLAEASDLVEVDWEEGLLAVFQCSGRVSGTVALNGSELQALSFALVQ